MSAAREASSRSPDDEELLIPAPRAAGVTLGAEVAVFELHRLVTP